MIGMPKIPENIFKNRCKYCLHYDPDGENRDFEPKEVFSYSIKRSCQILSVARYFYQVIHENGTYFGEIENIAYSDGECRSFTPYLSYPGICMSCKYHNVFVDGYCTVNNGKGDDYHLAFLANGYESEKYKSNYYTCSKWQMSENAKRYYLEDIIKCKVPSIIDPQTFKLIDNSCKMSYAAKAWAEIRDKELSKKEKESSKIVSKFEQLSIDL